LEGKLDATVLNVAAFCGRGVVRTGNEDSASVDGKTLLHEQFSQTQIPIGENHLMLVADGMGGHAKGEVASQLAIDTINVSWQRARQTFDPIEVIKGANRRVYDEMQRDISLRGMGSTVVGLYLEKNKVTWFNVGDSRCYLYRVGKLSQLSQDHVPRGDTSSGGTRSHRITQSIGGSYSANEVWPAVGQFLYEIGDRVLLCSDGLSDSVSDTEITLILAANHSPLSAIKGLKEAAFHAGAPDNVTCILVDFLNQKIPFTS
jgi:protein phosphatase